jgi:hypothetical protein
LYFVDERSKRAITRALSSRWGVETVENGVFATLPKVPPAGNRRSPA